MQGRSPGAGGNTHGERTFQSGGQMRPELAPATSRCPGTSSTPPRRRTPPRGGAPATLPTGGAPRPLGGDSVELAAPGVLSASGTAPTPPPAAERAPPAGPVAPGGEGAIVAASLSSTTVVRAGCFLRGPAEVIY